MAAGKRCRTVSVWLAAAMAGLAWFSASAEAVPKVVATIKPLHSLVAEIMAGVGEPDLLIKGSASEIGYVLRPEDTNLLQGADVVAMVGAGLEGFLPAEKLASIAPRARVFVAVDAPGIQLRPLRQSATWDPRLPEPTGRAAGRYEIDPHVWLDPGDARAIVAALADVLGAADPQNAEHYRDNALATDARLDALDQELGATLAGLKNRTFIVYQDAFHYLERRYDLFSIGSIVAAPGRKPGPDRVRPLRALIKDWHVACLFTEPGRDLRLIEPITEALTVRTDALDPLGAEITEGPELYFTLLRNNAAALKSCLASG